MVTRGFTGKPPALDQSDRIPPGQHLVGDFPVLSAGPTTRVSVQNWSFTLKIGPRPVKLWNWAEFQALPQTKMTRDIHCVTKWSKLDTPWDGVLVDDVFAAAGIEPPTKFILAHSFDGRHAAGEELRASAVGAVSLPLRAACRCAADRA